MPSTAPLRLVVSRAETPDVFQRLAAARPAPPEAEAPDRVMPATALASFAIHAAVLLWMAIHGVLGEERAAGAGEDLVLAEGIPVMLIEAAPMPEVPPIEATVCCWR